MKKIYLLILFTICLVVKGYSNVNITAPTKNTFCLNTYATINDIVIAEAANNDFPITSNYIFISAPAGFEFDPTQGTLSKTGSDISGTPGWVFRNANMIAISFGVTSQSSGDAVTISGLQLRATTLTSGTLKVETGSSAIGGMPAGTTLATVSTALTALSLPAVSPVCDNDAQFGLGGTYTLGTSVTLNTASYSSSPTSGAVSGTNFKPASASGDQTVTYTVKTNGGGGCTFTQSISINVKAAPNVTITAAETSGLTSNDNTTCQGDPITFTANGADTYQFKVNGTNGVGGSTVSPYTRMGLSDGDVVSVVGTYDGCSATSSNITVNVNTPPPTVVFNPSVTTYSSSSSYFVLDTLDSPSPFAADPWSPNSYFSGNGVVAGSGSNAGKDLFYPDVAATFGSSVSVSYTYVDANGCKKSTSQTINIVGGASTGSINNLNSSYCANGAASTISIASHKTFGGGLFCLIIGADFQYFEYFNPVYGIWNILPSTYNAGTLNYDATFDPTVMYANGGTGLRLIRAVYYSSYCGYEYIQQNFTLNSLPSVSINNYTYDYYYNDGSYPCSSWGDSTLTFTFSANASISGFSSSPASFLYFNSGAYKLKWSAANSYPSGNTINLTIQDGVTNCSNQVSFNKYVFAAPGAPTYAVPKDKCVGDLVTIVDTITTPAFAYSMYTEWYRKNGATLTFITTDYVYAGNLNTKAQDVFYVNSGNPMLTSDTLVVRQYYLNSCKSPFTSPIVIKVNTPPTVDAGTYLNICSTNPVVNLSGSRNPGTLGVTWTSSAAPVNSGFSSQTAINGTYTAKASEVTAGKIKLYLTTNDPDGTIYGCSAVKDSATIAINLAPSVKAGTPTTYCSSTGTISLLGQYLNTSTTSSTWYKGSVGGTQTGMSTPASIFTTYTLTAAEKTGGPIVFWIESNDMDGPTGPCATSTDQVTITISPEVLISAGIADTTCGTANISLSGSCTKFGGAALNATWSGGLGGTPAFTPNVNALNATYTPTLAESAGTSIVFTLTSDDPDGVGPCPALSSIVKKKINQQPTVDAGPDATFCSSTSPTLSATLLTGATGITWSRIGSGGTINTPLNTTTTYTIPTAEKTGANITFIATTNDADGAGPCPAGTDQVLITINPEVLITTGIPTTTCGSAGVPLSGTCTTFGGGNLGATWSKGAWNSYVAPATNPKNVTYTPVAPEPTIGGTYVFTLTSDDPDGSGANGPCPALSAIFYNTINPAPFVTASSTAATWCSNTDPVLDAALTGTATSLTWSKTSGSGTIQSLTATHTNYLVSPGDYAAGVPITIDFTATTNDPDGSGPCIPAQSTVSVTINPHLTVTAGSNVTACADQTITLNGNVKIGGTNRNVAGVNTWKTFNGLGGFTQSSPNFTSVYNPSGTLTSSGVVTPGSGEKATITYVTAYLVSTDPDGAAGPCKADSQSTVIRINPLPIPHFASTTGVEYCIHNLPIPLVGNLGSTFSPSGKSSASFTGTTSGGAYVAPSGFNYEFDPRKTAILNGNGGTYGIRYTYIDSLLCQNYVDTTVDVFPNPVVNFITSSRCQYDTITFSETATASTAVYAGTVEIDWDWKIDGDTIQNVYPYDPSAIPAIYTSSLNTQTTKYAFANYGIHSVSLTVTSNSLGTGHLNCSTTKDTTLIFGPYPNTDFSWSRPCSVDTVFFVNNTTIASGYSNSTYWNMHDLSNNAAVNYKVGNKKSLNPAFKFNTPGIYNVQLIDTTNIYNCVKISTKEVYVVPTYVVTASDPYDSSFANSKLNWAPSGYQDKPYSWQHGHMTKNVIASPNKAWVTDTTGNYFIGELSYLNSPCFDFSNLDKPMIVMKQWSNTTNLAGAVLEATTGNTNPWVTIGQIGTGINWYNTIGVVGLIGTSSTNPTAQGFSGEQTDWTTSRIGLSQYAKNSKLVRFRLVFGSSNVNDPLNKRDGIALDSVWIGNRFKTVLMEHFTNSLCPSCITANDVVNKIQDSIPGDVISVHYHTSFSGSTSSAGADLMNQKNPSDPSSRVLYYGVTSVPRTEIDGVVAYDTYDGSANAINYPAINNKALENAKFSLDLSTKKTGLTLDVKSQLVAKAIVTDDVVLNIAVLEKYISGTNAQGNQSGYKWVLKKMLPDAAGNYITKTWAVGDTSKNVQTWNFSIGDFYDTSQIAVVAFVQNYLTREVYQASIVTGSGNTGTPVVTSIDVQDIAENLLVYPVPADNEINVLFSSELIDETPYVLHDDIGRVVDQGIVEQGVRMLTFNCKKYAAGMYYLSMTKKDGSKLIRKIPVMH
ncbi:MAG TPA: hypothetical protein VNB90_14345 [Cytophagaceae bacterium]|nr:hypothetical protein [Cytophagaceae bacterium]